MGAAELWNPLLRFGLRMEPCRAHASIASTEVAISGRRRDWREWFVKEFLIRLFNMVHYLFSYFANIWESMAL